MKAILHILLTSSFSLLLLQLFSCQPEENCPERETKYSQYYISEDDKSKIPFTGTDTLVYISNDGDTAILYGQGKKAFIDEVVAKTSINPACPHYDYNYFENIEFKYIGTNPQLNTILVDINAYTDRTFLDVEINTQNINASFTANNNELLYTDTVNINNIVYLGRKPRIVPPPPVIYVYTHFHGFLQITTPNKVWLKKM